MASKTTPLFCSIFLFLLQIDFSASQNAVRSAYWFSGTEYPVSNIDSTLFTHLFCAFADLNPTTYRITISSSNSAKFSTFTQTVQQKNPSLKTLLSIGGGSSTPSDFASMAATATSRKSFIDSSIALARSNNFHGLDIDWEYPSTVAEMTNFATLLSEWRTAVVTESQGSGKTPLLLSAAVFRSSSYYGTNYSVRTLSNSLDWINVMAYDFYGPGWSPSQTGPPAALYDPSSRVSGDAGVTDWINAGFPAGKIVMGLPYYGWAWRLVNAANHGLFAAANGAASGAGIAGDGSIGYAQIKAFISQNSAVSVYNSTVVSNYCYSGTTWIGFDDTQSVSAKVAYAKRRGLLGYFAWQIAGDSNWLLSQTASNAWQA